MKIHKPQRTESGGVQLAPEARNILQPQFCAAVLGKPNSGKSFLIYSLFSDPRFYGERFDRILFIGPTRFEDTHHTGENTSSSLNLSWIQSRLRDFDQELEPGFNVLLVMDDVIAQIFDQRNNPTLKQFFFNRRHVSRGVVSILFTAQKWTSIPTFIRASLDMLFLFKTSLSESNAIFHEIPTSISKQKLQALNECLSAFSFMFINLASARVYNDEFIEY